MNKQALLKHLEKRRDALQDLVDRDFGGGISFNYYGALKEIKYLIVEIDVLNKFDIEEGSKKVSLSLTEKQLGTMIAFMQSGFEDREHMKKVAKIAKVKHLDNIDDELKILFNLKKIRKEKFDT